MTATAKLTTTEAAELVGTDAKTLRTYLRTIKQADDRPGKGARWELTKAEVTKKIKPGFDKWLADREQARKDRTAGKPAKADKPAKKDEKVETAEAASDPEMDELVKLRDDKLAVKQAARGRAKIARGDEPSDFERTAIDQIERAESKIRDLEAKREIDKVAGQQD